MKRICIFLVVFIFAISAWSQSQIREDLEINSRWKQVLITSKPGTRSEGITSFLYFEGEAVAPWFDSLVIGPVRFGFVSGDLPWDFKGYDRIADSTPLGSNALPVDSIDSIDLDRGWYPGESAARKAGTPESWIWANRDELELFFDPDRIGEVVRAHHLVPLSYGGALIISH